MTSKKDALLSIQTRVSNLVSANLSPANCLSVALAASLPRDREDVFGVFLTNNLVRVANTHASSLAIHDSEWDALFGKNASVRVYKDLEKLVTDENFLPHASCIEDALRCSLTEPVAKVAWKSPVSKLGIYVSLYMDQTEERISPVLGGLVRADTRRLDDLRSTAEDLPTDHFLLSKAIIALSDATAST